MIRRLPSLCFLLTGSLASCSGASSAPPDAGASDKVSAREAAAESFVARTLEARLRGDRTGACVAAALIGGDSVDRAVVCAGARQLPESAAFEIGSISKTMTGLLVARALDGAQLELEAPISEYLGERFAAVATDGSNQVPAAQRITPRDLLTHTSGLPSVPEAWLAGSDPKDPYAHVTEEMMLESLQSATLATEPGQIWAYSNFGYALLGYLVSRALGEDLPALFERELFAPLGLQAFVGAAPKGAALAQPHRSNGTPTAPWTFSENLSGAGGVRATLSDMVLFAQAALGRGDERVRALFERALRPLRSEPPVMGMAWVSAALGDRQLWLHDGATGGSSCLLAIDLEAERAVVALSDTSWIATGGLELLALHLLAPELAPLERPRQAQPPPPTLVKALEGRYSLGQLQLRLFEQDSKLMAENPELPPTELGYDSRGEFFSLGETDFVIQPLETNLGVTLQVRFGGGAVLRAERAEDR